MKSITPTPEEAALFRIVLDGVDPPLDGVDVGVHTELLQHDTTWARASGKIPGTIREDGTIVAAGQTVQATGWARDGFFEVEYPTGLGEAVAIILEAYPPGPERGKAVALAAKLRNASRELDEEGPQYGKSILAKSK